MLSHYETRYAFYDITRVVRFRGVMEAWSYSDVSASVVLSMKLCFVYVNLLDFDLIYVSGSE